MRNTIAGLLSRSPILVDFHADGLSDAKRRRVEALPIAVAVLVLAAYAVLLPAGRWQGDEYIVSWSFAQRGWAAFFERVEGWSPRPVGEFVTFLYFALSNALDRPLIGYFLGFLWLASLIAIASAGWAGQTRRPVAEAVLLFALTLLLAKPGEMFYWPMGAGAYLPCWAGLAAATMLHRSNVTQHRTSLVLALSIAAFSVEVGAMTVLVYVGLIVVSSFRDRLVLYRIIPLIIPALCALWVCLTVLGNRLQTDNEVFNAASGLAGNWLGSFAAALPTFAREAAGIGGMPVLIGFVIKLLLLISLPPGNPATPRDRRLGVIWGVALLLAAFASVVLAYHQFGMLCCERHSTLRQGMVLLALATFAGLLGRPPPIVRHKVLTFVLLVLLAVRVAPLYGDWSRLGTVIATRQANWKAATEPGDAMTLKVVRGGHITNSDGLPPGTFRRSSGTAMGNTPWYAWGIMARFDKHALTIAETNK